MEIKVCSKCRRKLTVDNFSKNKNNKDNLQSQCKECNKQYRADNGVAILEYKKVYRIENKLTIIEGKKIFYQKNKETLIECHKQYNKANKEAIAERSKQYWQANKKAICKYQNQWRGKHLKTYCMYSQRRRAAKLLLPATLTAVQWESIKQHFNNCCAYCGKEFLLTQEHFVPVTKGGGYTQNNIIPACQSCNSSKGNKQFEMWYPKYEYYSGKREATILKFLSYKNGIQQLALSF